MVVSRVGRLQGSRLNKQGHTTEACDLTKQSYHCPRRYSGPVSSYIDPPARSVRLRLFVLSLHPLKYSRTEQ